MTEQQIIQNWITNHLVKTDDAEINTQQVLWGKLEKKILLIVKTDNIENDSALIKKVIGLTQNFAADDFAFIHYNRSFSLINVIHYFGAEKILLFNFKPSECAVYFNGISDEPMLLNGIEICFLPYMEKCVTDPVYKIRFAKIWLKILNTKWIQK